MRRVLGGGFGLVALLALGALAWSWPPEEARPVAAVAWLGLLLAWIALRRSGAAERALRRDHARLVRIAGERAAEHARTLAIKRNQLIVRDAYGTYDYARWTRHLAYFIERVVLPAAEAQGVGTDAVAFEDPAWFAMERAVEAAIEAYEREAAALDLSDVRSGADYEQVCRALLEAEGWAVAVTAGTGDQGADLVAERAGRRVVIQCKFYGRPVGNRAVQEAFAAKRFQGADHAAVVSNAAFTRSARQLALTNDVLLLHHDELTELDARLRAAA